MLSENPQDWFEAGKVQTIETLPVFISNLMNREHTQQSLAIALTSCATGAIMAALEISKRTLSKEEHNEVFWTFIREFGNRQNSPYLRLQDMEGFLYPDADSTFEKVIPRSAMTRISAFAENTLKYITENNVKVDDNIREHMQKVADGFTPYNYSIIEGE